jgi:hypothetical protein
MSVQKLIITPTPTPIQDLIQEAAQHKKRRRGEGTRR